MRGSYSYVVEPWSLFSSAGQYKLSVDILLYLTKVPRFEMNAMFLGPIEKEGKTHFLTCTLCTSISLLW